jgi:predicted nucleic acid-binding protein
MSEQKQIVYIDTSILISPLFDKEDKRRSANNILNKLAYNSKNYEISIPHIVVGEAINAILLKSEQDFNNKLQWFINMLHKLNAKLKPLEDRIADIALKLRKKDDRIDFCDLIIIAHAIYHTKQSGKEVKLYIRSSEVNENYQLRKTIDEESDNKVEILED